MEITVGGHFHLKRRVGSGSFGEVFYGEDVHTHEAVAIKLEKVKSRAPQLFLESKLYLLFAGGVNVPRLHWFGTESCYNVMVVDYLGKSLEDLFQLCHQKFTLKTVLMIAEQCLASLQFLHNKSFMHRDVKPDNFLVGRGCEAGQIFIIDFGLSKKYRDPNTLEHIRYASGKSLTGTARYASVNALKGYEQSRRDDLEALAYCLIYFLRGRLPWMGIEARTRQEKYEKIMDIKSMTPVEEICEGCPTEFATFLNMVRDLRFFDEPEYAKYRAMFRNLFINSGFVYDYKYDWVNIFSKRGAMESKESNTNKIVRDISTEAIKSKDEKKNDNKEENDSNKAQGSQGEQNLNEELSNQQNPDAIPRKNDFHHPSNEYDPNNKLAPQFPQPAGQASAWQKKSQQNQQEKPQDQKPNAKVFKAPTPSSWAKPPKQGGFGKKPF